MYDMNKKKALAESIEIYKVRINQVNEKLKGPNISDAQRRTLESEKTIATEEMAKLEIKN